MKPIVLAATGVACIVSAQVLWFTAIAPRRPAPPDSAAHAALPPGEFAGTLMLGGFRGLACDLLWMRATTAKDQGRHYESIALFQAIAAVQPRFPQVWEYLSWDLAYNLGFDAEGPGAKYAWFVAGVEANAQGCRRNPGDERILRHLAWMLHHKGDDFHDQVAAAAWGRLLDPVIAGTNAVIVEHGGQAVPLIGDQVGISNFALSSRLYTLAVRLVDATGEGTPHATRRLIPLGWEFDGNLHHGAGRHREALAAWITALQTWDDVRRWEDAQPEGGPMAPRGISREARERNGGRLRRRAEDLATRLAPDSASAEAFARALDGGRWDEARQLLASGWRERIPGATGRWLDEGRSL
jgi:hypothetical protein